MNFLSRVVKYMFWLLVVSWSVALLRAVLGWMVRKATAEEQTSGASAGASVDANQSQGGLAARRLVRDPVCGTHVAEVLAIPLRESGELIHFCSTACRDKYVASTQRMAANG